VPTAQPKPAPNGAPLSVSAGDTDASSSSIEAVVVKPSDASVSGLPTEETTFSIPTVSVPGQQATSSETDAQKRISASNFAAPNATTNETDSSSPKEATPQASTFREFSSEPAPGTSIAAPADSRLDGPIEKAGTWMKSILFVATLGLLVLGILSFVIPKLFKSEKNEIRPSADVEEIAASIASKLARNREGSLESGDLQNVEAFVLNESKWAYEDERPDESAAPKQVTPEKSPPRMKTTSDEYWANADACLNWAREAPTDEVRLGCLALAETWLRAAMRYGDGAPSTLPWATTL
jgi:hypothetical protein